MYCPNCESRKGLEWQLCACEFKCSNCGELFTINDLAERGLLTDEKKPASEQTLQNEKRSNVHPNKHQYCIKD